MLYIISDQSLIGCLTIQCVSKIKNGLAARYKNFQKLRSFVKRKIKNLCKCFFKRSITCIITLFITCDYLSQFSIWKKHHPLWMGLLYSLWYRNLEISGQLFIFSFSTSDLPLGYVYHTMILSTLLYLTVAWFYFKVSKRFQILMNEYWSIVQL